MPAGSLTRVRALRAQATRLRHLADEMNVEANLLEGTLSDLPLLGGKELRDEAVAILAEATTPMHYRALLTAIETRTGKRVRGVEPAATLLAGIDRDERIQSCGMRSGLYELVRSH